MTSNLSPHVAVHELTRAADRSSAAVIAIELDVALFVTLFRVGISDFM
jgi:hypothetical protein